ncbi:hypothetical protein TYRP_022327 [Tyrophagus putrescentiae]|nr:hypothetical protein TYRP_022327 [Tyrophagus putrescentiae]
MFEPAAHPDVTWTMTTAKSRQTSPPWTVLCCPRNNCALPAAQSESDGTAVTAAAAIAVRTAARAHNRESNEEFLKSERSKEFNRQIEENLETDMNNFKRFRTSREQSHVTSGLVAATPPRQSSTSSSGPLAAIHVLFVSSGPNLDQGTSLASELLLLGWPYFSLAQEPVASLVQADPFGPSIFDFASAEREP